MSTLSEWSGQRRIQILRVSPEIDGGKFPSKAIIGDTVFVQADFLVDGIDTPAGQLLYRHEDDSEWQTAPFYPIGNDRYQAAFVPNHIGFFAYTIEGWVNHSLSWLLDIQHKIRDFQPVSVELRIGARFFQEIKSMASVDEQYELDSIIQMLENPEDSHPGISFVWSDKPSEWFHRYPIRAFVTRYEKELTLFADREKAAFSSWYTLFPRSTSPLADTPGTIRTTINLLPRLAELGFDVLHLPPIHPIGIQFRKGKNNAPQAHTGDPGAPYAVGNDWGGHDTVNPELGTLDDLLELITAAKQHGLELAMDLSTHCSPDHPWIKKHPEWFKIRPDGSLQYAENPPHKYCDSCCFDFESEDWQGLWLAIRDIVFLWAKWGVRIIRVDQPHGKPFALWEWLISETKKVYPDMLFLAESFTSPKPLDLLARIGFSQSLTYFIWRNTKHELTTYLTELTTGETQHYLRPNFWPNTHDINPYPLQSGLEPVYLTRLFLAATLSSNYGIFGPSYELMIYEAYPGREEYLNSEKYEIRHWDWQRETKITLLIRMLNQIRRQNTALQRTNNLTFIHVPNDQLLAYLKTHPNGNRILCVVNLDPHSRQSSGIQIPLHLIGKSPDQPFIVHDLLTDNRWQWQGEWNYVELDPTILPMHLFRIEDA